MDATTPPIEPLDALGVTADAKARVEETFTLAARHLDPSLVDVLRILGFDKEFASAQGSHLYDAAGRAFLDFHTGEGFASLGHNHPGVREVLQATLAADLADGVQIHYSALAGMLAEALTERLPAPLEAVFFASTGAEAVDSAMKFARAATGRPCLISCDSSFHGVTLGPLSLVGDDFFKDGFGPLLPGCARVPFGDLDRLEAELRRKDVAAFFVEPIQGREVTLPPDGYLKAAQDLCRRYGTLFVADEIQTGLGRTGKWFALEHWALEPDFVLVGKALSGGYMPVAAMITTRAIYQRAVGALERSYVHQSTYGRNRLSMAAGLATMRIIERDGLVEHTARIGALLRDGLLKLQHSHEMISEVRARGLMIGIELGAPSTRAARVNWRLIHMASEGLFPQLIVIPLHRDHRVITMAAGKNDVIKLLPPLTLSESEANTFLQALDAVLGDCESHSKNWGVVRDIAVATLRRRGTPQKKQPEAMPADSTPCRGTPVDLSRDDVCLVTGASGFIGGRLAQRLASDGHQVRCLVRAGSDTSRLEPLDVEIALGDLRSERSLARAVEGCNYVFTAARSFPTGRPRRRSRRPTCTARAACSRPPSARRSSASSTSAPPTSTAIPTARPIEETHTASGFRNWYAQTKLRAEAEVRRVEAEHSLDVVILRPATVYGPGSSDVVGEIARAMRARNMLLVGGGRAVAGLCYVDNLIDAAVLALAPRSRAGPAFNVSDGLDVTWREFTDGLAEGLGYVQGPVERALLDRERRRLLARARLPLPAQDDRRHHAATALPPSRAGARQQPGLQQPQGARAARLGAACRLCRRARRDARLAAQRVPRAPPEPDRRRGAAERPPRGGRSASVVARVKERDEDGFRPRRRTICWHDAPPRNARPSEARRASEARRECDPGSRGDRPLRRLSDSGARILGLVETSPQSHAGKRVYLAAGNMSTLATDKRGDAALSWATLREAGRVPHQWYDATVRAAFAGPAGTVATRTLWSHTHATVAGVTSALNGRGELIVAWVESQLTRSGTNGAIAVLARWRSRRGRWSAVQTVGRSSTSFSYAHPELAVGPSDEVLLTWNAGTLAGIRQAWRSLARNFARRRSSAIPEGRESLNQRRSSTPKAATHIRHISLQQLAERTA